MLSFPIAFATLPATYGFFSQAVIDAFKYNAEPEVIPQNNVGDGVVQVESGKTPSSNEQNRPEFSKKEQKRIVARVDRRIVVLLGAMYAVSLIDRTNTGIAFITGMGKDMELTGERYNIMNAMFFVTYTILQLPSTLVLRKVGPRYFLTSTTLLWGMTTIACGMVRNWTDLVALRLVLGVCEAGFFPGCTYLLSCWYPRYSLQKRNAAFFLLGLVPAACSGILAYGISHMQGIGEGPSWWGSLINPRWPLSAVVGTKVFQSGIAGWRWIFFIYGIVTCVVAIGAFAFVVDFPEKLLDGTQRGIPFLTKDEATWVVNRIEADRKDVIPTKFSLPHYLAGAMDLKVWAYASLYCFASTTGYGIAFSLPIILTEGMGFSIGVAQCLVTPPYVVAGIATWAVAYYADKWRMRSPFILFNSCLVIVGLCLIGFVENVGVRYFGVFFASLPGYASAPCIITWQANNVRGQWKRALVSATAVGAGAVGGIIGSLVFRTQDRPHYRPGMYACLTATVLTIIITLLMDFKFIRANKRAATGGKPIEGLVGFRYTL